MKNKHYISLFFKGMGMGAADLVPGVSGGSIAFIVGIYEELISSLAAFNMQALKLLCSGRIKAFWRHVNATFLLILFSGIVTSIFSLTRAISWAINTHPKLVWGYFFGLILASVVVIAKAINFRCWISAFVFILATWLAFEVTQLSCVNATPTLLFVFISGAIAICAMVLPGISGSFILLLLGMYQYIIQALHDFNVVLLVVFFLGCISGLLGFARFLSWLLRRFYTVTLATLTGFMLGALNKVWPWKQVLDECGAGSGKNLSPWQYEAITQIDPQIIGVILLLCLGFLTVFLIERVNYAKPMD